MPYKNIEDRRAQWHRWCANNPDKLKVKRQKAAKRCKLKMQERYAENEQLRAKIKLQATEWGRKNPFKVRLNGLKHKAKKYGHAAPTITAQELQQLFEASDGLCDCCKEPMSKWCVDHDHRTGKIRGIVCADCNLAEGHVRTSKRALLLMEYIKKNEDN